VCVGRDPLTFPPDSESLIAYQVPPAPHVIVNFPFPTPSPRGLALFLSLDDCYHVHPWLCVTLSYLLSQDGVLPAIVLSEATAKICLVTPGSRRYGGAGPGQLRNPIRTEKHGGATRYWPEARGECPGDDPGDAWRSAALSKLPSGAY
jgi:hypothetical protein